MFAILLAANVKTKTAVKYVNFLDVRAGDANSNSKWRLKRKVLVMLFVAKKEPQNKKRFFSGIVTRNDENITNDEDESMELRVFGFFEKGEVCEEIKNRILNGLSAYLFAPEKGFEIKKVCL